MKATTASCYSVVSGQRFHMVFGLAKPLQRMKAILGYMYVIFQLQRNDFMLSCFIEEVD